MKSEKRFTNLTLLLFFLHTLLFSSCKKEGLDISSPNEKDRTGVLLKFFDTSHVKSGLVL